MRVEIRGVSNTRSVRGADYINRIVFHFGSIWTVTALNLHVFVFVLLLLLYIMCMLVENLEIAKTCDDLRDVKLEMHDEFTSLPLTSLSVSGRIVSRAWRCCHLPPNKRCSYGLNETPPYTEAISHKQWFSEIKEISFWNQMAILSHGRLFLSQLGSLSQRGKGWVNAKVPP